ncbi:hypothetical protein FACS1894205_6080 [Alphaproteobacteria bacterium]|nr:hypothetical protein FACS1894205_6080 [Alphaproteobacteria bacterium]
MKSDAAARDEWRRLSSANADILGAYQADIVRADLGEKGVFWRLRAASMSEAQARSLCAELKKRGQGCIVARK